MIDIKSISPESVEFDDFINVTKNIQETADHDDFIQYELSNDNPFWLNSKSMLYVAYKDNLCVGRILSFIDKRLTKDDIGMFGYFDCINDEEVAIALFEQIEQWFKALNISTIHGPINLNIYTRYRLQTKGFEQTPFIGEPRNPEYYVNLVNLAGYKSKKKWYSWDIENKHFKMYLNLLKDIETDEQFVLREVNIEHFEQELQTLFPVAMEIFSENYAYSEITLEEFLKRFMPLEPLIRPGTFLEAMLGDEIVGFVYGYADVISPETFIIHTIGIKKAYRHTTLLNSLFKQMAFAANQNGTKVIGAFGKNRRSIYSHSGLHTREYAIFEKQI